MTLRATLSGLVTQLGKGRERVFDYAQNFAQDSAMLAAEEYAVIANAAAYQISSLRARKSTMVEASVRTLADMAAAFDTWLWVCVIAALIILGPLGMTVIYRMVSQLVRLTHIMVRLARNDTSVVVPFTTHRDEVGNIARAVTVFRKNAIALLEQEARLKALNQQFNAALSNMSQGLCMFDADKRVVICNQRYRDIYSLSAAETRAGTSLSTILELCFARGLHGDRPAEEYITSSYPSPRTVTRSAISRAQSPCSARMPSRCSSRRRD